MNKLLMVLAFSAVVFAGCSDDEVIKGMKYDNYPVINSTASCRNLNMIIAAKLLNEPYNWAVMQLDEWSVAFSDVPDVKILKYQKFLDEKLKTSSTHDTFMHLIDGEADIILTHRTISPEEQEYALAKGVRLTEIAVANDALDIIVNPANPIKNLTIEQLRKIYRREITNWKDVEGNDAEIDVYARPRDSDCGELMRQLVIADPAADIPEVALGIEPFAFHEIYGDPNAISHTLNSYKTVTVRYDDTKVPKIAINGVFPDDTAIGNGVYPFAAKVYIAIRNDIDPNSMAYRVFQWLQTDDAKSAYQECGFVVN